MNGVRYPDRERYLTNRDYADGVAAGIDMERSFAERTRAEQAAHAAKILRRAIGWQGPDGGIYFWFVGWDCWSFGAHICFGAPNIEIHLPFGFIRIGWHTCRKARREMAALAEQSRSETHDA